MCIRVIGVSAERSAEIGSAGREFGFRYVDPATLAASDLPLEPIRAAVQDRDTIVVAGAESQPVVWTADNVLVPVINLTIPVRVRLEFSA